MNRDVKFGAILTVFSVALACNRDHTTEVETQARDLREAQNRSPQVVKELETDLAKAKEEVVRLEQKLVLARQGITDEVVAERKELEESLKDQERRVQTEISEAKREAEQHNVDTVKAQQALQETNPPEVAAEVNTETHVKPSATPPAQTTERQELIPVRGRETTTTTETRTEPAPAAPPSPAPAPEAPESDEAP